MKKILVQMTIPRFANNELFVTTDKQHFLDHWRMLKQKLFDLGYDFITADNTSLVDCENIIFVDQTSLGEPIGLKEQYKNSIKKLLGMNIYQSGPMRQLYKEAVEAGMRDKLIFIMFEGKAVCPTNFSKSTWDKFNKILTWDDDIVDNEKFSKFFIPTPKDLDLTNIKQFKQKKLLVNISFNKYSSYKAELYSERRKSIAYFDKHYPKNFDLFGPRWNIPITRLQMIFPFLVKKYKTYRGITEDKQKTLANYKFVLAYENNGDGNGYITEKMFDAIKAKTVPIYLGAQNVLDYVPENVFIDRRKFESDEKLAKFLEQMSEAEYNKYIEAGQQYLRSENYKKFSPENFCKIILKMLDLKPII